VSAATDLLEPLAPGRPAAPDRRRPVRPAARRTAAPLRPAGASVDPLALAESMSDWSPRRIRVVFLVLLALVLVPVGAVTVVLWLHTRPVHSAAGTAVGIASGVWILLAVPVGTNCAGILGYRRGSPRHAVAIGHHVCFRIVTRGTNVEAVCKTVRQVREQARRLPLFPYSIEVVTDSELPLEPSADLRQLCVPRGYATPGGARFKARALHYALEVSSLAPEAWILHLDEETHVTPSVLRGVAAAVAEEEQSGAHRVGQGAVLYHRDLHEHPLLTLADSIRTGDDLGRFRLQHFTQRPLWGLHGSFILVRNDVEQQVGFDFGPDGSVTEDAWWALLEMAGGRRTRWVDGYCLEQSTRSAKDFVKQRRRWFVGLMLVCRRSPAPFRLRAPLLASVVLWGLSWIGWWGVMAAILATGTRVPLFVFATGVASVCAYVAQYLLGLELNLAQRGLPLRRRIPWHLAQLALTPVFSALESSAVVYALVRPERGFHVVKK
jgi:egghead protein (zeste-white 4 protein)